MHRSSLAPSFATLSILCTAVACSVFESPDKLLGHDAGIDNSTGGKPSSGGKGGTPDAGSGSVTGAGGTNAGGMIGMSGGATGAGGVAAGGMSGAGGSKEAGVPSGPTEPWWPHSVKVGTGGASAICDTAGVPKDGDRVPSDPGDTIPPLYFAMNRFLLGAVDETPDPMNKQLTLLTPNENAWLDIGLDLDGACTNSSTCQDPKTEKLIKDLSCTNSEQTTHDGNKCIDNSIGYIFNLAATSPLINQWFGMGENDWNCELWRGGFSTIFKVSDYNGQYNDDSVRFDMYTSTGLQSLPTWSCRKTIDAPLEQWDAHAIWSKRSHWIISQDSISPSADGTGTEVPDSKWADPTAYVRGGWLIVHLPDASWVWLNGERTPVPGFREIMHRNVTAVKLVHDEQSDTWSMDQGTMAFVARPAEMLEGFAQIGFCENMCGTFDTVKAYLNTYQDMLSTDTSAPNTTPCDSLSYGNKFKALQISATKDDVKPTAPFATCPQPRHPAAPRQGCVCSADRSTCLPPDGGK
jgi:hypothetical protein